MKSKSRRPAALVSNRHVKAILSAGAALLALAILLPPPSAAHERDRDRDRHKAHGPVTCMALVSDPANGLVGNPDIKSLAGSGIVARPVGSSGATVTYCEVDILYGTNPQQNINIRVGLPLNSVDGGSGGVEGAWNGRTQGVGGGGCSGNTDVTPPVSTGYVGSGTDLGHVGGDCTPGVNPDGTYNYQFIQDFIRNAIKEQVLFAESVARTYYGMKPAYNYWNGCSTGGRQGYLLAQELPDRLDGILASAPAMYWTRFQTAQMWGQIVMRQLTGGPISEAKLAQTTASAVDACDAADGVTDGVIDDPRTCKFDAKENICGAPTAPAANCLTPNEAEAIDKIWDGPRNSKGEKIWYGLDRGTQLGGSCIPGVGCFSLDGTSPFFLGVIQLQWDERDLNFDWTTMTMDQYAQVAQDGSRNIADVTDTFGNLDEYRRHGGKLLTLVGGNDQLIMPRGVIGYYRQMASRYSRDGRPDFKNLQRFYRLFRNPGAGHCQVPNGFPALVDWVEHGVAPKQIIDTSTVNGVTRTRPLCPYPQTAIYNGSGDTNVASNFHCGGNLETPAVVCADVLTKYKHEVNGPLDYRGTGVSAGECAHLGHHHHHGDHDD